MEFIHKLKIRSYHFQIRGNRSQKSHFHISIRTVEINHTFVDASLRGQGIAGKLMTELISELEKRISKRVPTCSYAVSWFEKHRNMPVS